MSECTLEENLSGGDCSTCTREYRELRERAEKAESMIRELLASATPHPVEHPTMWRAWRRAEKLLGIPIEKSRTIPTTDKALEARLLSDQGGR